MIPSKSEPRRTHRCKPQRPNPKGLQALHRVRSRQSQSSYRNSNRVAKEKRRWQCYREWIAIRNAPPVLHCDAMRCDASSGGQRGSIAGRASATKAGAGASERRRRNEIWTVVPLRAPSDGSPLLGAIVHVTPLIFLAAVRLKFCQASNPICL